MQENLIKMTLINNSYLNINKANKKIKILVESFDKKAIIKLLHRKDLKWKRKFTIAGLEERSFQTK